MPLLGGFLNTLEIGAADAVAHADVFERMRAGELQAVVVRDVYDAAALAPVVERLENNAPGFLQTWFPQPFRAWFYGRNLNLAGADLTEYFAEAAQFERNLRELFAPLEGLEQRVGAVLAQLDHGRPFAAAPGPRADERYMFTTLRAHTTGGYIARHFDNEQALRPSYAHLRGLVDLHMTSFVLTLQAAEAGGALQVYDLRCEPQDAVMLSRDSMPRPDTEGVATVDFRIPAGAMIVLDSGRYLHRVTNVEGARKRWVACSFMARARDGGGTYCWG